VSGLFGDQISCAGKDTWKQKHWQHVMQMRYCYIGSCALMCNVLSPSAVEVALWQMRALLPLLLRFILLLFLGLQRRRKSARWALIHPHGCYKTCVSFLYYKEREACSNSETNTCTI
jgi:hypothetical protein